MISEVAVRHNVTMESLLIKTFSFKWNSEEAPEKGLKLVLRNAFDWTMKIFNTFSSVSLIA